MTHKTILYLDSYSLYEENGEKEYNIKSDQVKIKFHEYKYDNVRYFSIIHPGHNISILTFENAVNLKEILSINNSEYICIEYMNIIDDENKINTIVSTDKEFINFDKCMNIYVKIKDFVNIFKDVRLNENG